jgi:hypothetical protein
MSFIQPSTRPYSEEVDMIFSALDCALHGGDVIYASSEITSGFRLYEAMREHNVRTAGDLKKKLKDEWYQDHILKPNTEAAKKFAEEIRATLRDNTIVITPAPFSASQWTQFEYLYLWEQLLRTRVKSVRFNVNWQFSNGCTFEFAVAEDAGLPTFDHRGAPLPREAGIELINTAIQRLESQGFDTAKLRENLERLLAKAHAAR